jgi:hypothetical protein
MCLLPALSGRPAPNTDLQRGQGECRLRQRGGGRQLCLRAADLFPRDTFDGANGIPGSQRHET